MTAEVVLRGDVAGLQNARNTSRIAVPINAVFADTTGKAHVWVVDTKTMKVEKRPVTVGEPTGENQVWVLDGLRPGETIAVTAVHELKEGEKIRNLPESY
jgi:multidrug efflux pump subunit AcrA (membrane-fusion protein)